MNNLDKFSAELKVLPFEILLARTEIRCRLSMQNTYVGRYLAELVQRVKDLPMSEDDSAMVFCAFRYCLGRETYIVGWFCEYAITRIRKIHTCDLEFMAREITEARDRDDDAMAYNTEKGLKEFDDGARYQRHLGDDCDRADWLRLLAAIKEELKRRG